MTVREKIVKVREENGWTIKDAADACRISQGLMRMIEEGEVTHPKIVRRIRRLYDLTELEAEELMPECRRVNGPKYEPDRYVDPDPIFHHETGDRLHKLRRLQDRENHGKVLAEERAELNGDRPT